MHSQPLPPQFDESSFTVADAIAAGVSRGRLRSGDLSAPYWGIRAPRAAETVQDRCRDFRLRLPRDALYSHITAAMLHGLPVPSRHIGTELHVGTPRQRRPVDAAGICGHRMHLTPGDRAEIDGVPVTTVERTWTDLAGVLSLPELVAAGDVLVRRWGDDARRSVGELIERYPRRRGRPRARLALALLDGRAESPMESRLRLLLVEGGFTRFQPNVDIFGRDGRFIARADLVDLDRRLILEYEGDHHRTDAKQWHRDVRRTVELEDDGWRVIRITRADMSSPTRVYASIHAHYRRSRGLS